MALYAKIQTQTLTDAKLLTAGPEAGWLWLRGILYSKEHLTDGFVPDEALVLVGIGLTDTQVSCSKLVQCGLWQRVDGGYTVGSDRWARHQTTKAEVEEDRNMQRDRQKRYREKKAKTRDANVTHNADNALQAGDANVTRPEYRVQSQSQSQSQSTEPEHRARAQSQSQSRARARAKTNATLERGADGDSGLGTDGRVGSVC